jgi:hypothetical protein
VALMSREQLVPAAWYCESSRPVNWLPENFPFTVPEVPFET